MRASLGLVLLVLFGCTSPSVEEVNPHTGLTTIASRGYTLELQWNATLAARAVHFKRNGTDVWSVYTYVSRDDRNTPLVDSAWSFGRKLPYRKIDRRRTNCAIDCNRQEQGEIVLNRRLFEILSETGLTFHLVGKRGSYTGHLPADAFANVLAKSQIH